MAKKQKFSLDEYGFSTDLDTPSFNFKEAKITDDRKPVTKLGSAFLKGAKDQATSPAFIRNTIKRSMPAGYGEAMDLASQAGGALKDLYDNTAREVKPVIKEARKVTARILPSVQKVLPKSVAQKIKEWTQKSDDSAQLQRQDQRETEITATLGQIFKFQQEQDLQRDTEREVQSRMGESFAQGRHSDQMGQLNAMRVSLQQLANYQANIDARVQRKSLELQFRHYFVAVDLLEEQKRSNVFFSDQLKAITKNTGLPEYAKLKMSERFAEMSRNKFVAGAGSLAANVFGLRSNFVGNLSKNIQQRVMSGVKGFADNARAGLGMADMMLDANDAERQMAEMMGEKPKSFGESVAGLGGNLATEGLGYKLGKTLRKHLNKNDTVVKRGNQLLYGVENAPQLATEFARGNKGESGLFGGAVRMLKDSVLQAATPDNKVESDSANKLHEPAIFNRQTNKSINEIIPGFLARILRELKVLGGDPGAKLVTYDFSSNKFADSATARKNIFKSIVKDSEKSTTKWQLDRIMKDIDPQGKLSEEQRTALAKQMLKDNMANRAATPERLMDAKSYQGEAGKHAAKYADLFREHFANDPRGEKKVGFARKYSGLGRYVSDSRSIIQNQINLGNREHLEELGILKTGSDSIDMEKLMEYFSGDPNRQGPPEPEAKTAGVRRLRSSGLLQQQQQQQRPHFTTAPPPTGTPAQQAMQHVTPPQQQQQPQPQHYSGLGKADLDKGNDRLIEAIHAISPLALIGQTNEALARIEKHLIEGIPTMGATGQMGPQQPGGKKRWWEKTLGETVGDTSNFAGRMARSGMSALGRGVQRSTQLGGQLMQGGLKLGRMGLGLAGKALGAGRDQYSHLLDIYVKGEVLPRLSAIKMKAGEYYDATSKTVIKNYRDIKGAVVDKDGNVILSAEDAKRAFVNSTMGQKLLGGLGAVIGKVKGASETVLSWLPPIYRFGVNTVKSVFDYVFNSPQDVYVKGKVEEGPRLLAYVMRGGGYFSASTKRTINHPGQIDGPVVDVKGEVKLSLDDLKAGLVNIKGQKLRTGLRAMFGAIGGAIGAAKRMVSSTVRRAFKFGNFIFGKAKALGGTLGRGVLRAFKLGGNGQPGSNTGTGNEALQGALIEQVIAIRQLLEERLTKPQKQIRIGSLEDMQRKADDDSDDDVPTKGGRLRGLLGRLRGRMRLPKLSMPKLPGLGGAAAGEGGGLLGGLMEGGLGRFLLPALAVAGTGLAAYFGTKALGGDKLGSAIGTKMADVFQDDPMKKMDEQAKEHAKQRGKNPAAPGAAAIPPASAAGAPKPAQPIAKTGILGTTPATGKDISVTATAAAAAGTPTAAGAQGSLDGLEALRMKAYGLSETDALRVGNLKQLEASTIPGLSYSKDIATWSGNPDHIWEDAGFVFATSQRTNFDTWFQLRFLPVFTNYATQVAQQTGSKDIARGAKDLSDTQAYAVAQVLANSRNANGRSIWDESASPWDDYDLSTSKDVVQGNLQALKEAAEKKGSKPKLVADPTSKTGMNSPENKPKSGSLGDGKSAATKDVLADKPPTYMDSLKDRLKDIWEGTKNVASQVADKVSQGASAVVSAGKSAGQAVASTLGFGGGAALGAAGPATGGSYDKLPTPKGEGNYSFFKELFEAAGKMAGVNPNLMAAIAAVESGFKPAVKAPGGSATGLFQFISGTWRAMLRKYGPKYGIDPSTPPTDARANALLGAEYVRENSEGLQNVLNRPIEPTDVYMAHFLGLGGARKFLQANPSQSGPDFMPQEAAANRPIFFDGSRPRTLGEIYQEMKRRVVSRAQGLGLSLSGPAATSEAPAKPAEAPQPGDDAKVTAPQGAAAADAGAGRGKINPSAAGGDGAAPADSAGAGAGRGSINPPMAIPVSDQAPAVAARNNAPSAAAPAPAAGAAADPTDPALAAAGGGIQVGRVRDLQAQSAYQRESSQAAFGPLPDLMQQSLDVNRQQLTALLAIQTLVQGVKTAMDGGGAGDSKVATAAPPANVAAAPSKGPAQPAPRSPVPMSRGLVMDS